MKRGLLCLWLNCACWTTAAQAQIIAAEYTELARQLDGRVNFEALPREPEPGVALDAPLRAPGAWVGSRFAGQTVSGALFDRLHGTPDSPLRIVADAPGRNLSIALHRGFGSNAVFPLGPAGFPAIEARGEGALAVLFDRDQWVTGIRVHSGYADALGQSAAPGAITVRFHDRAGGLIAERTLPLSRGITEFGFRHEADRPVIAGFTVTTTDPGGIAIDDILFQRVARTG